MSSWRGHGIGLANETAGGCSSSNPTTMLGAAVKTVFSVVFGSRDKDRCSGLSSALQPRFNSKGARDETSDATSVSSQFQRKCCARLAERGLGPCHPTMAATATMRSKGEIDRTEALAKQQCEQRGFLLVCPAKQAALLNRSWSASLNGASQPY